MQINIKIKHLYAEYKPHLVFQLRIFVFEGDRDVIVMDIWNRNGDASSNPLRGFLHFI